MSASEQTDAIPAELETGLLRRTQGEPLWLLCEPDPIYAVLHASPTDTSTPVAVLMLPTFGWDNDTSYRSRHAWACKLAAAGFPTLRIDLPGSEDSVGSPLSDGRYRSWQDAVAASAQWLREYTGCVRVAAVGIGLGGLLAYQAAASGDPIDDLILWAVPAHGRSYVRELRAFARMASGSLEDAANEREDGAMSIGGHLISAETAAAIAAVRLDDLTLPDAPRRRVLLIDRDDHGVDQKLQNHLTQQGVQLTLQPAGDYAALMELPEFDTAPSETIASTIAWLDHSSSDEIERGMTTPAPASAQSIIFEERGTVIRERLTSLMTPQGRMVGIITEPVVREPRVPALVTISAGALRRTGTNRLNPVIARRAAAAGVPAARFDLPGLGDSDGRYVKRSDRTHVDEQASVDHVRLILDHLETEGVGNRFISFGLCGGAYWPMRAALVERRLIEGIFINVTSFKWTPAETIRAREPYAELLARRAAPPQGFKAKAKALAVSMALRAGQPTWRIRFWRELRDARELFNAFRARGMQAVYVFSRGEQMLEILECSGMCTRLSRWPELRLLTLPTTDHDLRPLAIQELIIGLVETELEELTKSSG